MTIRPASAVVFMVYPRCRLRPLISSCAVSHSRLSTRVLEVAESPTLAIDAKAKALKLAGENVIGFGAGEPDFATPEHIVAGAVEASRHSLYHHYTPTAGLPELRAAVARKTRRDSGFDVDPSQVLICNGGKHALFNAFATIVEEGDEVLLPAPYWVSYPELIELAGGMTVVLPGGSLVTQYVPYRR